MTTTAANGGIDPMNKNVSAETVTVTVDVIEGPDLNESRTPLDKKLYRQILLPNGLRAILVSDTTAMHQHQAPYHHQYEDGHSDESSSETADEHEHTEEEEEDDDGHDDNDEMEEEDGLREAAAAMVVGVGSMYDPLEAQGMAHFLEHMLFMGTKKYPEENAYDAFLSKQGGSDNAYTELEYTVYHLEIPQEGLFQALDMFAQFFIHPLMSEDSVERELNSIESEFQLSKNSDSCRLQQLMCHTCGYTAEQHPFRKFSWGNLKSLKEIPETNNVSIMDLLRTFYNQYYYAANMRLVVMGGYSLDVLQRHVVKCFSEVPSLPREPSPLQPNHIHPNSWEETYQSLMADSGLPFHSSFLGKIFRMVPVQDRHSMSITWQLPSQIPNWRTKPCDYIAHLLGHEAQGSLLSSLKEKSWVTACFAGVGSEGLESASSHALFALTFSLSKGGVEHWREIVTEVYRYVGMLRYYASDELPEWIHQELKSIHELSYRYADEPSADDFVQDLAGELAPHNNLPPERLLDGSELLFDYDPNEIKTLLNEHFQPKNMRLDLMSSTFGRAADYEAEKDSIDINDNVILDLEDGEEFDPATAGSPSVEPMFGPRYWCRCIPQLLLDEWTQIGEPQLPPPDSMLSLPPKNPFVPQDLSLKSLPPDDSHHPLVHSSLKLCITIGKKKTWFPATVVKYDATKNQILLSYEDEEEKWHTVDQALSELSPSALTPRFEGTLDCKEIKYRIVALAKDGEGAVLKFGDESDNHVEDGVHFPPIPPALSQSRLPQLITNTQVLKFWHLQDRKFKRPIAEMRINVICTNANKTPLHRACADLFVILTHDAITETSYLASVCELGCSIESTDVGFAVRVHGFNDKLLELFKLIVSVIFGFRGRNDESELPEAIKEGRFESCLEVMRRKYANHGLKASNLASDVRLRCLRPSMWSSHCKALALENVEKIKFSTVMTEILDRFAIDALYHGNVDQNDAEEAKNLVLKLVDESGGGGLPKKKYPAEPVTKIPPSLTQGSIVLPSKNSTDPNTAVEIYFQIGKDNLEERVIIDLLSHMMYEPIYDQIRTKDQFGYEVSCDARWTNGVMGIHFRVVSSTKSAAETVERIDKFLMDYRKELSGMKDEDFMEHLVGLAKNKLDMHSSLSEESDSLWGEIRDGRYEWEHPRNEAVCLRTITKARVLASYDEWLSPTTDGNARKRRMLAIQIIGSGEGSASLGRPEIDDSALGNHVDEAIHSYRKAIGNATWGPFDYQQVFVTPSTSIFQVLVGATPNSNANKTQSPFTAES